jgi:hypothetical protein
MWTRTKLVFVGTLFAVGCQFPFFLKEFTFEYKLLDFGLICAFFLFWAANWWVSRHVPSSCVVETKSGLFVEAEMATRYFFLTLT